MDFPDIEKFKVRTVIEPSRGWSSLGLRDLWEYRELLYFMVLREVQGRYRQTALGMSWLFIRPILNTLVLTVTFGLVVKVPSDGVPYPLFSMAAMLPWSYFSNSVNRAAFSLVENRNVISKVYFPRMVIPLAAVFSGLIDFAASFIIFIVLMIVYRMPLRLQMLWLPLFLSVAVAFALAVGLWLATLAARFHDVQYAISFLITILMYASPVIYSVSLVPQQLRWLYALNPMTGVIEGFRWACLGSSDPPGIWFLIGVLVILVGLVSGAYFFRRTERTIVDVI